MVNYHCWIGFPRVSIAVSQEANDLANTDERALSAYLLGSLNWETLFALQRRLAFEIDGNRDHAAVIVCEPQTGITVGREGSAIHIRAKATTLAARGWPVRWVGRGGGAMLHVPGQVACYPLFALDSLNCHVARYVNELVAVASDVCREFGVRTTPDTEQPGLRANGRRIAHIGVAVCRNVTSFGLVLNVNPDLAPFWDVRCDGDPIPMTSLQRESSLRVRTSGVRQRLLELLAARFGFTRVSVFHHHPAALPRTIRHALPHAS
jgi:lipoyl(octanoyl) transferase